MKTMETTAKKTLTNTFPKLNIAGAASLFKSFESYIKKTSEVLDAIAGWGIFTVTFLTVINIILRVAFKSPLLGTYEYVGFLTSLIVSFSLAWCAVQNGHIAIEFILERFPKLTQSIVEALNNIITFILVSLSAWGLFSLAAKLNTSGEVSATVQVPFHYFVLASALGFLLFGCVILMKAVRAIKEVKADER